MEKKTIMFKQILFAVAIAACDAVVVFDVVLFHGDDVSEMLTWKKILILNW